MDCMTFPRQAGEDLSNAVLSTGAIYKAIAMDDGRIATGGNDTPAGILQFCGKSGENVTIGYFGRMRYTAAESLGLGARLTINGSGYMIQAGSRSWIVGINLDAQVNSGAVGWGLFDFTAKPFIEQHSYFPSSEITFGAQADLSVALAVGKAVDNSAGDFAATPTASAILYTGTVSGGTSLGRVCGVVAARAGGVIAALAPITAAASGWITAAVSGGRAIGHALAASAAGNSGSLFNAYVDFDNHTLTTSAG